MARQTEGVSLSNRRQASYSMNSMSQRHQQQPHMGESYGPKSQASPHQQQSNERTPLLNSIGAAAESLMNNSVVGGSIQQGVSWRMAAFLLVNTALGAGMLNYPYAYNQIGGVFAAAMMQAVLLVFISSTMFILVYCADLNHNDTYHDVLLSMCGKRAQQISALSILLTCYGINITFLVIIGDQYDRIFHSLLADHQLDEFWFLDRKFTIFVTSILFIWPMCYAQRLDFLRYASVLGMFAMLYVAFLTVYEHYVLDEATIEAVASTHSSGAALANQTTTISNTTVTPTPSSKYSAKWWLEPLAIVPVLCFAYQTHEVIVPVYACMKDRFIGSFMKASLFGLVILFLLYNLVGAYGYLTFGDSVGADIMSLYDGKDPIVVVGIIALVVKFITTYPPLMFCGRSALDGLYGELRQFSSDEFKHNEKCRRVVISTLWFFSTVALAVFAPDISVTLQLLGSMASINVFVFPGMCLFSLTYRLRRARRALLMGELSPYCSLPNGYCNQQRAKDYHMISGSYFGAAMKRRQQQQQQQQMQQQQLQLQHSHLLRKQLLNNDSHWQTVDNSQCNALAAAAGASNGHSCQSANTNTKQFTATFASLIEFENNLVKSTCSNDDKRLEGEHNSLLLLNGAATTNASASAPIASSSSSSGLHSSSGSGQLKLQQTALIGIAQNGHGEPNCKSNGQQQQFARSRIRQDEFERLITNGSNAINVTGQQILPSSGAGCIGCCCCASRSINDSHEHYGDCHGELANNHSRNHHYNNNDNNGKQQVLLSSLSSSFRQFIGANQKLLQQAEPANGLWTSGDKKSTSLLVNSEQKCHCLPTTNCDNYAEQSVTNSLLNKFSTSIAPSTVAQIGISRCAAMGLYFFAGLLIAFGAFIFVLELVNVFGLLE